MPDETSASLPRLTAHLRRVGLSHGISHASDQSRPPGTRHAAKVTLGNFISFQGFGADDAQARDAAAARALEWAERHYPEPPRLRAFLRRLRAGSRNLLEIVAATCPKGPEDRWHLRFFVAAECIGEGRAVAYHDAAAQARDQAATWRQNNHREPSVGEQKRERGRLTEERVFRLLAHPPSPLPSWFAGVRESTEEEDAKGIDLVVETDKGQTLLFQIKSSNAGREAFLRMDRHDRSIIVLVGDRADDTELFRYLVKSLKTARHAALRAQAAAPRPE